MSDAASAASLGEGPTNPLVSIITRTLGRPTLPEAAACVAAQTWRPLEWVVVDAAGTAGAAPAGGVGRGRGVPPGRHLPRARGANGGRRPAGGDLLLVLDDDDLILPGHLAHLAQALAANPDARLAYSDWEARVNEADRWGGHAPPFSHLLLCRQNLFPPHAALFDASLVRERGLRVDEGLEFFEDWDFWLAAARLTRFVHSPQCTAVYRTYLSQSGIHAHGRADADPRLAGDSATIRERYRDDRERLGAAQRARIDAAVGEAKRGDLAASAAMWNEAHIADPFDPEPITRYAELAFRAGDRAVARQVLEAGIARLPDEPSLRESLRILLDPGRGDADAGRPRDAVQAAGGATMRQNPRRHGSP